MPGARLFWISYEGRRSERWINLVKFACLRFALDQLPFCSTAAGLHAINHTNRVTLQIRTVQFSAIIYNIPECKHVRTYVHTKPTIRFYRACMRTNLPSRFNRRQISSCSVTCAHSFAWKRLIRYMHAFTDDIDVINYPVQRLLAVFMPLHICPAHPPKSMLVNFALYFLPS